MKNAPSLFRRGGAFPHFNQGGGSLRYPAENKKDTEIGVFFVLVEISGIEPLTS